MSATREEMGWWRGEDGSWYPPPGSEPPSSPVIHTGIKGLVIALAVALVLLAGSCLLLWGVANGQGDDAGAGQPAYGGLVQ